MGVRQAITISWSCSYFLILYAQSLHLKSSTYKTILISLCIISAWSTLVTWSLCQFKSFKTRKTQCIMETLKAGWVFGTEIVEDQGYIRHGSICCPRPQNHPRRRRSPRGCRPSPCASSEFWAGGGASATTGPWEFCV